MEQIIVWESRGEIIRACELAVHQALKELGLKAIVTVNSEAPLIGRHHLWARLPVLEIQGLHWSLTPGCAFRVGDLKLLSPKVFASQIEGRPCESLKEAGLKECFAKEGQEAMENIELTDADFKARLERTTGLLFFYKKRCPNCRALEKMLEKFFSVNAHIAYMRIDSEECPEAMKAFGTERVPTIFLLREGQIVAKKIGLMNLREMTGFYQSA